MGRFLVLFAVLAAPLAIFASMILADRTFGGAGRGYDYVVRVALPPPALEASLPPIEGPNDAARPLVVIDAGHGGKDPGAGSGALKEKALTLALARAVRDQLLEMGGIRVALTRDDDRFLVLGERSQIARRLRADLFLSIHADSVPEEGTPEGGGASGGTVYVLSAKGSSEAAEKMAARENAADVIDGVNLGQQSSAVSSILFDLSQRETQAESEEFGRLILREGAGHLPFREKAEQSAAFAVLKAPDLPSVLFESGYISNKADVARLTSPAGRAAFAGATARAIRAWFARHAAASAAARQLPGPSFNLDASVPEKQTQAAGVVR